MGGKVGSNFGGDQSRHDWKAPDLMTASAKMVDDLAAAFFIPPNG
jgi:hypothetical protein